MAELLEIDGVSLRGQGFGAATRSGRYSMPSRRGENYLLPGRSGSAFIKNKPYDEGMGAISVWATGATEGRVVSSNLAPNPSLETNLTGWSAGTGSTASRQTTSPKVGTYTFRSTLTAQPTSSVPIANIFTGANRILASPGELVGARISVRSSGTGTVAVRLLAYNGLTETAIISSESFATSGAWRDVSLSGILPAGSEGFGVQVVPEPSYALWPPASYMEADALALWKGIDTGEYYSGATTASNGYTYAWTGTANESASFKTLTDARTVPTTQQARRQAFEDNMNKVMRLFTRGHRLSTIRAAQPDGTVRRALVEWREWSEPEVQAGGTRAEWAIAYTIPSVWWEDESLTVQSGSGTLDLTSFTGMTGVIEDAVITVTGASTAPKITDAESGAWVQYTGNLSAGQQWVIDVGAATSKVDGTSVLTNTIHVGNYKLLVIPNCFGASNTPRLTLSGGGTFSVSARKKWVNG